MSNIPKFYYYTSASFQRNLRIQVLELDTRLLVGEPPVHAGLGGIASIRPSFRFAAQHQHYRRINIIANIMGYPVRRAAPSRVGTRDFDVGARY